MDRNQHEAIHQPTDERDYGAVSRLLTRLPDVQPPPAALAAVKAALAQARPVAQMTCDECDAALADCADSVLDDPIQEKVAVHQTTCRRCSQTMTERQAAIPLGAAIAEVQPPPELRAQLAARLAQADCRPVAQLTCEGVRPLLSERLDAPLREETAEGVDVHLANCAECTRFALALGRQQDLLRAVPELPAPEDAKQRVLAGAAARRQSALVLLLAMLQRSRRGVIASAAAGIATLATVLGVLQQRPQPPVEKPVVAYPAATPVSPAAGENQAEAVGSPVRVVENETTDESSGVTDPVGRPAIRLARHQPRRGVRSSIAPRAPRSATSEDTRLPRREPAAAEPSLTSIDGGAATEATRTSRPAPDSLARSARDTFPAPVIEPPDVGAPALADTAPADATPPPVVADPLIYVVDSPAHAPSPDHAAPALTASATPPAEPADVEIPPADAAGSRPGRSPLGRSVLAGRQPTAEGTSGARKSEWSAREDGNSKTAEVDVVRVEF